MSEPVVVTPASSVAERSASSSCCPFRLYEGVDQWVPPLISERKRHLDRRAQPVLPARRRRVLPGPPRRPRRRPDLRAGRPALQRVPGQRLGPVRLLRVRGRPRGRRGAARRRRATGCASAGRDHAIGPLDFSTNHECGLLVEGFELRPQILENWHHPYYGALLEGCGLTQGDGPLQVEPPRQRPQRGDAGPLRAGRQARARARDHDPRHAPQRPRGRDRPLHGDLQRRLGAQLGLRPADRARDPPLRQGAEADPRRELGDGRRDRRTARRSASR